VISLHKHLIFLGVIPAFFGRNLIEIADEFLWVLVLKNLILLCIPNKIKICEPGNQQKILVVIAATTLLLITIAATQVLLPIMRQEAVAQNTTTTN
jgi:hypothetical protein